jgi:hypothetical protein
MEIFKMSYPIFLIRTYEIFLTLGTLVLSLWMLPAHIVFDIPYNEVLEPLLMMLTALFYIPMLVAAVRDGAFRFPYHTFLRDGSPVIFWFAFAVCFIITITTIIVTALILLGVVDGWVNLLQQLSFS